MQHRLTTPARRLLARGALFAAVLATLPSSAMAAEWRKLTVGAPFSDVVEETYRISPDGRWVVFWHDRDIAGAVELYSAPVDGSALPVRISGILLSGSPPGGLQISADSATVVYSAEQDTFGVQELYSVPIAGGASVRLNGPLITGGDVSPSLQISPSGDRVVYAADQEVDDALELYSVPLIGGAAVKLNATLSPPALFVDFLLSPAGDRVAYRVNPVGPMSEAAELYSVPITGGAAVNLSQAILPGSIVLNGYQINPAGDLAVFILRFFDVNELYSVPLTGGAGVKLNASLVPGGDVTSVFQISPLGDRVVYRADQETDDLFELYSVPITGGAVTKLSGSLPPAGDVRLGGFRINSGGFRVVYLADQEIDDVFELYSVRTTGGNPVKLNGALATGAEVTDFQLSPNGSWVVYRAGQNVGVVPQLFRVPVPGPAGTDEQLSGLPVRSANHWRIDPRGDRVVAISTSWDGIRRPWRIRLLDPLDFTAEELVDESLFAVDGDATSFAVGPEGSIVYRADQDIDEEFELYSIPAPLFEDGFESGNTLVWSSTAP